MRVPWLELSGIERLTIELDGRVPDAARCAIDSVVEPERDDEGVIVSVLLFWMRRLGPRGLPGPRFDYAEALFRVGVHASSGPAWLVIACDLDHPAVARLGAALLRYPVRRARFGDIERADGSVIASVDSGDEALKLTATPRDRAPVAPPRAALVSSRGSLFRIPWAEEPPTESLSADIAISDDALATSTFGAEVSWRGAGRLLRGRIHRCSVARRVR